MASQTMNRRPKHRTRPVSEQDPTAGVEGTAARGTSSGAGPARLAAIAVGAVLVGLIAILALGAGEGGRQSTSPLVGQRVPTLSGQTLSGEVYDIDDRRGSWVLVNFFATWCPPCVAEHDDLVEVSEWGRDRQGPGESPLEIVSLVFDQSEREQVETFFAERGGDWPVSANTQAVVDFQVAQVPETFVVAPSGVVVARLRGGVTADQLKALVVDVESSGEGS